MRLLGMAAFAVLLWALVHGIGGAMWDLADGQQIWWNGEGSDEDGSCD